jgi:hypothetical protein
VNRITLKLVDGIAVRMQLNKVNRITLKLVDRIVQKDIGSAGYITQSKIRAIPTY